MLLALFPEKESNPLVAEVNHYRECLRNACSMCEIDTAKCLSGHSNMKAASY